MALWKKTDDADTADSTVSITTVSGSKTVTGTTTNIKEFDQVTVPGNTEIPAGTTVQHVVDGTHFTINKAALASNTITGTFVHKNVAKPKFQTVAEQKLTFGVDVNEILITPATHTGWVKVTEGSGARAGRKQYETIVAMGSMGLNAGGTAVTSDAEDTAFPDPTITISVQPTALTERVYTAVTNLAPITLGATVSTTAIGKTVTTYQWKVCATSGGSYVDVVNVSGNTGISGATTNTLTLKSKVQDTKFYKLAVTATPPVGSPITSLSNAAKVAGGVLISAGTWAVDVATITAAGHNVTTGDAIVVSGTHCANTPFNQYNVSNVTSGTVAGNDIPFPLVVADPGSVDAPFTGIVYKYVA